MHKTDLDSDRRSACALFLFFKAFVGYDFSPGYWFYILVFIFFAV